MNADVSQQLLNALSARLLHMFWCRLVPAIVVIGVFRAVMDLLLQWAERKVQEFVRDLVASVGFVFGNPRVSDDAVRRARRSGYRNR